MTDWWILRLKHLRKKCMGWCQRSDFSCQIRSLCKKTAEAGSFAKCIRAKQIKQVERKRYWPNTRKINRFNVGGLSGIQDLTNKKVKQGQSSQRIVQWNGGKCKSTEVKNFDKWQWKWRKNDGKWWEINRGWMEVIWRRRQGNDKDERSGKFRKMVWQKI